MIGGEGRSACGARSSRPCGRLGKAAWKGGCGQDCPPHGQALVEFAIAALITLVLIFGVVEFCRIMLVYTTIADAARLGARYAVTHGTIPGSTTPSSGSIISGVEVVVDKFLAPGTVNTKSAVVSTTFPDGATMPGNRVQVTVSYPYDLLIHYLPISVTLSTTSQGIFTW